MAINFTGECATIILLHCFFNFPPLIFHEPPYFYNMRWEPKSLSCSVYGIYCFNIYVLSYFLASPFKVESRSFFICLCMSLLPCPHHSFYSSLDFCPSLAISFSRWVINSVHNNPDEVMLLMYTKALQQSHTLLYYYLPILTPSKHF